MKKITIYLIGILFLLPQIFAFGAIEFKFAGIDSNNILSFNPLNDNLQNNQSYKNPNTNSNSKKSTSNNPVKSEVKITLNNKVYTQSELISMMSSEKVKNYVKGFGYECIYINSDKNANFTLYFNLETGAVTKVTLGDNCDKKIYFEESLLTDLSQNGFSASNIKEYLKKVELPTSMYFKAIKVFTVG